MYENWPCKNCTERHLGCHSDCNAYVSLKAEHIDKMDRLRERKRPYIEAARASAANKAKAQRRKGVKVKGV